jgi:succinate-acetate transporter protein
VRSFLLLEVAYHLALGCWFVVTLCVAVSLKSICSERYLVECVFGVLLVVFINLALLQLLTTETGYCRAGWVSVVRSPTMATR